MEYDARKIPRPVSLIAKAAIICLVKERSFEDMADFLRLRGLVEPILQPDPLTRSVLRVPDGKEQDFCRVASAYLGREGLDLGSTRDCLVELLDWALENVHGGNRFTWVDISETQDEISYFLNVNSKISGPKRATYDLSVQLKACCQKPYRGHLPPKEVFLGVWHGSPDDDAHLDEWHRLDLRSAYFGCTFPAVVQAIAGMKEDAAREREEPAAPLAPSPAEEQPRSLFEMAKINLAQESILHSYGYNVGKTDDLGDFARGHILKEVIRDGAMTKGECMTLIRSLVARAEGRTDADLTSAISRWKRDLDFLSKL